MSEPILGRGFAVRLVIAYALVFVFLLAGVAVIVQAVHRTAPKPWSASFRAPAGVHSMVFPADIPPELRYGYTSFVDGVTMTVFAGRNQPAVVVCSAVEAACRKATRVEDVVRTTEAGGVQVTVFSVQVGKNSPTRLDQSLRSYWERVALTATEPPWLSRRAPS